MRCPQCHAEAAQVGKFWVCPNHGQLSGARAVGPLRIFLSYGHDSNEGLVRRIKADLEKRGHDVWFDKSEIKFGDEWRRSITDGIVGSHRVLSFLSKHSTRDPGVCLDEIAIAIGVKGGNIQTVLVESEREVQPPVNIGHIQWLDMHDWKDGHGVVTVPEDEPAVGDASWETWYQAKLAEVVHVVESEESRRFAGEIETLKGDLRPIRSETRICQLLSKGFCGRQWLFDAVENWRRNTTLDSRLFWIQGAPGVGKSAFAAQLTHTRGDTVIAAQFCEWDKPDHRDAKRVVCSLAFQLATRLPDYRKLLLTLPEITELDRKNPSELFQYLLVDPLRHVINGGRQRYLIVIDALDEAGEVERNPLVEMLARDAQLLPDWLGVVVTSRPEFDVKISLQALNPFPIDTASDSNRADIRDYLRRELAAPLQDRVDGDHLIEQILEKSEGVFLYVERLCDDVLRGNLVLDHPEQFPQGLGGIFCQYFQRQFPDLGRFRKHVRPALRAILAAREPLPVTLIQGLFGMSDEDVNDFTLALGSLFPVYATESGEVIKPYHKTLVDWLSEKTTSGKYYVSPEEGAKLLTEYGWREYQRGLADVSPYFLRHLPTHLGEAGRMNDLSTVLQHKAFLESGPFSFLRADANGLINVDLADLWSVIQDGGRALIGMGSAKGENRALDATAKAITSAASGRMKIAEATRCLIYVNGPESLGMREVHTIVGTVKRLAAAECNLIFGVSVDGQANDTVTVTVFAGGFGCGETTENVKAFHTGQESEPQRKGEENRNREVEQHRLQDVETTQKARDEHLSTEAMQQLLTALGRFHRHAAKGPAGAESWPDDCMDQLQDVVTLARENKWSAITEAAVGTARILKSYENAGCAHLSIPYLNESYEMLCLMVGDIIVGDDRPKVIAMWRKLQERAVAEATKAGLALAQDQETKKQETVKKEEPH